MQQQPTDSSATALFPNESERRSLEQFLLQRLEEARRNVLAGSVSPTLDIASFRAILGKKDFQEQESFESLLEWTISSLEKGLVQMTHPGYFGLFNPAPTYPSICADIIAADFNPQVCVWSHAPVAVEIEDHVISQVCKRIGFTNEIGGHFTSGGSEANNTAVVCALTAANSLFGSAGARAFSGQPRLYVSKESHLAWYKIAHQLGIGRDAVRLVGTDGAGRMSISELDSVIRSDIDQGDVPFLIAATAGTTNAGVVDALPAVATIAEEYGLWFHVDAAWGGALISSEEHKSVLAGIEMADSVTIDAHKWFATTMGAGMYLTQRKSLLSEAFKVSTSYMPSNDKSVDLYVNSVQWSRRFVALRLFLSLGVAGWSGYGQHVDHAIKMIDRLKAAMNAKGWTVANDSKMAVACLVPPKECLPIEDILNSLRKAGSAWVSSTKFEGREVIRVCATNGRISQADVDMLCTELVKHS